MAFSYYLRHFINERLKERLISVYSKYLAKSVKESFFPLVSVYIANALPQMRNLFCQILLHFIAFLYVSFLPFLLLIGLHPSVHKGQVVVLYVLSAQLKASIQSCFHLSINFALNVEGLDVFLVHNGHLLHLDRLTSR